MCVVAKTLSVLEEVSTGFYLYTGDVGREMTPILLDS